MELRQLEYFVAVAEEANFTRAAERVHVAQPAVSAQMAKLERELGQPLLDRTRREVRLTAAGTAALPFAREALRAVADLRTAVDEVGDLVRGSVSIGTVTAHNTDMPALLAEFHRAHPAVEITLGADDSDALIDGVLSGRLDLAIASIASDAAPEGLDIEVIADEALEVVVAADDSWCRQSSLSLAMLARRPLIALPVGTGIRRRLDVACAAAGVSIKVAFEAGTPDELADLAGRGFGPAVVPQLVARARTDLHRIPISPELRGRLALVWRSSGPISPAARALIDLARKHVRVSARA
ncbi:LysR substrate-binding domain-containing protein [Mycobacterium sp. 2YAF39]|uniref:LysR substrate-binding domain-containing protein n=1 Tax=Mycobacterium sp. 2YAF39 TaxID=3233033 RepID=UPI003F94BD42